MIVQINNINPPDINIKIQQPDCAVTVGSFDKENVEVSANIKAEAPAQVSIFMKKV